MSVLFSYSRGVFTLFLFFSAVGLALVRVLYARFANASWRKSGHPRRVLVFGGESAGREITHHLRHQVFIPVGVIEATGEVDLPGVLRVSEEEALAGIRQGEVDQIIVDLPPKRLRLLLRVAKAAEREGIPLQMTPAIFAGMHLRPRSDRIGSMPVIELCGGELPFSGVIAKRAFDLVASTMGIVFLSPVLLVIALLVKLTSPGPVLFRQKRVGLDGRRFHMLKFRTMVANAEDATGPVFAVTDDPRCTRVGRILRRTNLDELPQLFNIFMGTMSLVGPRPERPVFVEEFKPVIERYSHKHWVKPGVTGWAQVNGWRGRTDIQRRIDHDMEYVERWSFWFDLKILYLTVVHAFRGALPGH
jgi:exopolysaccharide biosynthesis polyprenyl glycosylphosphotransferase